MGGLQYNTLARILCLFIEGIRTLSMARDPIFQDDALCNMEITDSLKCQMAMLRDRSGDEVFSRLSWLKG